MVVVKLAEGRGAKRQKGKCRNQENWKRKGAVKRAGGYPLSVSAEQALTDGGFRRCEAEPRSASPCPKIPSRC